MALIVEVVDRQRRVIERHRFEADNVSVGRAYDNDLVIAEPHVDAQHCVFERDVDGRWQVRDLGSVNGVRVRNRRIDGAAVLASGVELVIGRVRLHVLDSTHPVPPAQPLNAIERLLHGIETPPAIIAIVAAIAAVQSFRLYVSSAIHIEAMQYLQPATMVALPALAWALVWSLVGSLLKHEARFAAHFATAGIAILGRELSDGVLHWLSFNTQSLAVNVAGSYLLDGVVIYLLLAASLYLATHQTPHSRRFRAAAVATAAVAAMAIFDYADRVDFSNSPEFVQHILPDTWRLAPVATEAAFLESAALTFDEADSARDEIAEKDADTKAAAP